MSVRSLWLRPMVERARRSLTFSGCWNSLAPTLGSDVGSGRARGRRPRRHCAAQAAGCGAAEIEIGWHRHPDSWGRGMSARVAIPRTPLASVRCLISDANSTRSRPRQGSRA